MQLKRRIFFVLLFIISFNTSIPNEKLESGGMVLYTASETQEEEAIFYRIKPALQLIKIVKCKKLHNKLNIVLQQEIL